MWNEAIQYGLERDYGNQAATEFDDIAKSFVYYGDLSNTLLKEVTGKSANLDELRDVRCETLKDLKTILAETFIDRRAYKAQADAKNGLKRKLAKVLSKVFDVIDKEDIGANIVAARRADLKEYWAQNSPFGNEVRERMITALKEALDAGDEVLILSHSLGTIVSYDALWMLSWDEDLSQHYGPNKVVDTLITLGSPLGDGIIKKKLLGASKEDQQRYPRNIRKWINVSAKHDYIAVDSDMDDDFDDMLDYGLDSIMDVRKIYNFAKRNGESRPHSSLGYLIHPKFTKQLQAWMHGT